MPRAKPKVVEESEKVIVSGVDVAEIIDSNKPKEELPIIDWLTAKNKLTFLDYVALRAKYGLEG